MAQIEKLEVQTEIKSSAEKFYEILRLKPYLTPKICPDYVKDIKVLQGDWESVGSVRRWTYVCGNCETVKETIEAIDDKERTITFNMLEGEVTKYYKTFKPRFQVITMGQSNFSKWTVEYEKQNDNVPPPKKHLEYLGNYSKAVDAYLLNN